MRDFLGALGDSWGIFGVDRREIGGMGGTLGYCESIGEKLGRRSVKGRSASLLLGQMAFTSLCIELLLYLLFVVHSVRG